MGGALALRCGGRVQCHRGGAIGGHLGGIGQEDVVVPLPRSVSRGNVLVGNPLRGLLALLLHGDGLGHHQLPLELVELLFLHLTKELLLFLELLLLLEVEGCELPLLLLKVLAFHDGLLHHPLLLLQVLLVELLLLDQDALVLQLELSQEELVLVVQGAAPHGAGETLHPGGRVTAPQGEVRGEGDGFGRACGCHGCHGCTAFRGGAPRGNGRGNGSGLGLGGHL